MSGIIDEIRETLRNSVVEKDPSKEKKFFKEEVKMHGVSIPTINRLSKEFFQRISNLPKDEIFALC